MSWRVVAGAAALLAIACRAGSPPESGALPESASGMSPDLRISVTTDRDSYRPGEPVRMTLRVVNDADREITLRFSSGQRYDFVIRDDGGGEVWRWSEGKGFIQMLGEERLAEGGELRYEEEFRGSLEPGRYRLVAQLTAVERDGRAATDFDVES